LIIDVQDDGVGLSRKEEDLNEGGVNNSRLRLRKAYGEQARLMVTGQARRGVLSRIEVERPASGICRYLASE